MFGSMADLLSFRRQLYKTCLICSRRVAAPWV